MKHRLTPTEFIIQGPRLLRLYSYYSLSLALILMLATVLDFQHEVVGSAFPKLMLASAATYVLLAAIFSVIAATHPDPELATSYIFFEVVILACMMLASGGHSSGFSSLIAIPVVISSLLTPGLLGYGVAAWTTLALIYTQIVLGESLGAQDTVSIGLYGFLCFILSWITQTLAQRLTVTLSLASKQAARIQRLQQISRQALLDLPSGIIACDRNQKVLFFNHQAKEWFNLIEDSLLPIELQGTSTSSLIDTPSGQLLAHRVPLKGPVKGDYLLTIENSAQLAAEAQRFKLAALGRLTASIAHEIRNPLSSLRQAGQLLAESPQLPSQDLQLTDIIEKQCLRINHIIEDVLQLSRRKQAKLSSLLLKPTLMNFMDDFKNTYFYENFQFTVQCPEQAEIFFDDGHLQQILHNLCTNALRYALKHSNAKARINLVVQPYLHRWQLDVTDNGGGISAEQLPHLFEPFYTSEHKGTGLGLYLCRELAEANHATIQYLSIAQGACFRLLINAKHPEQGTTA